MEKKEEETSDILMSPQHHSVVVVVLVVTIHTNLQPTLVPTTINNGTSHHTLALTSHGLYGLSQTSAS